MMLCYDAMIRAPFDSARFPSLDIVHCFFYARYFFPTRDRVVVFFRAIGDRMYKLHLVDHAGTLAAAGCHLRFS